MRSQVWVSVGCAVFVVAGAVLVGAQSASAAKCPAVDDSGTTSVAPGPGVNWSGCNLAGATLPSDLDYSNPSSGANLAGANLSGANLYGAALAFANLTGANLARTNFGGAQMAGVNMSGANLKGANLAGAGLVNSRMRNADVTGATFTNNKSEEGDAYICGKQGTPVLFRTRGLPKSLPKGWGMRNGHILAIQVSCSDGAPDN